MNPASPPRSSHRPIVLSSGAALLLLLASSCSGASGAKDTAPLALPSGEAVQPVFQSLFALGHTWTFVSQAGDAVSCRVDGLRSFDAGYASRVVCDGENGGVDGVWAVNAVGLWRNEPDIQLDGSTLRGLTQHPMLLPQKLEASAFETEYEYGVCRATIFQDERGWCIEEQCGERSDLDFSYCFDENGISFITDNATSVAMVRRDSSAQ